MITNNLSYELAEVSCEKTHCNETFSILIFSKHTVISNPFGDSFSEKEISKTDKIDDSLDFKCGCGHSQRVYLKEKQHMSHNNFDSFQPVKS